MVTNMTENGTERRIQELEEAILRLKGLNREPGEERPAVAEAADIPAAPSPVSEITQGLALAPLVDKIAYGLAKGLVMAMKELEDHIGGETRKLGDAVERRLDGLQNSLQELAGGFSEQRALNLSVQEQCRKLALETESFRKSETRQDEAIAALRGEAQAFSAAVSGRLDDLAASLRESETRQSAALKGLADEMRQADARQAEDLAALRLQSSTLARELNLQQEDITAIKSTLGTFTTNVDRLTERLDRQAEALRSMCSTYAQRESELEQLVEGLARLRAYPAPPAANSL